MTNHFWIALCFLSTSFAQTVTTIAGTGAIGFSGDGGPAVKAQLSLPTGVRTDGAGNIYFADNGNRRIRKIDASGNISTVAGNGALFTGQFSGVATDTPLLNPGDVAIAQDGTLYIIDGLIQTVSAGNLTSNMFAAGLSITIDSRGVVYYADGSAVYRYNANAAGTLVAGVIGELGNDGDGGAALQAHLTVSAGGLTTDMSGNVYVSDFSNSRIRRFTPGGTIQTVAGTGVRGYSGDGGPATQAQIAPLAIASDTAGNLYIADGLNNRVRRVDPSGIITTVYYDGSSSAGFEPDSITVDSAGNIYIAVSGLSEIQKIAPAAGAKPVISSSGIVSAAGNVPGLTPGGWLAIYGQNLAGSSRSWQASDFQGQQLPRTLDGVSVLIDDRPAAVSYISPGQIDVQVPDDAVIGPVPVSVENGQSTSDPVMVNMATYAPAFFTIGQYIAAFHGDNTLVGKASLAAGATPARPGETVVVYGTGFGPTSPVTPAGIVVNSANPLADPTQLSITIGGVTAQVQFAGLVAAGLYQFNIVVPNGLAGDLPISATIAHAPSQTGLSIPVQP